MKIIDSARSYLLDDEFRISIFKNKVDIINYKNIDNFNSNEIVINYDSGKVFIIGQHLSISKLLLDEVLISGSIEKIELR